LIQLYSWGCNDQKALGRSGEETEPAKVEGLDDVFIVSVVCGDSVSAALSAEGQYIGLMVESMHGVPLEELMGFLVLPLVSKSSQHHT
jgi:hypothetical protein